jgi:hypothetical protein
LSTRKRKPAIGCGARARGRTLGHALYSDRSQIAIRMLTRATPLPTMSLRNRIERRSRFVTRCDQRIGA